MKTNIPPSLSQRRGYVSLMVTLSLTLTLIAFAITAFRETRQSHQVQTKSQVRLDYNQKERAFLRALIEIVPSTAMRCMSTAQDNPMAANLTWDTIFTQALAQAQADIGLNNNQLASLNINANVISANTGNGTFDTTAANFSPAGIVSSPNGSGARVQPSTSTAAPNPLLPPPLAWSDPNGLSPTAGLTLDRQYPTVSFEKRLPGVPGQFSSIPYPQINFGYANRAANQNPNFIAKQNWWAFTVDFSNGSNSGIAPAPKTYALSLYEVPTQLALSSAGITTRLGSFSDNTNWNPAQISVQGSVYAENALVTNLGSLNSISSRGGVNFNANAAAGLANGTGSLADRRNLTATAGSRTTNVFHPFSSSSDSGTVSFVSINRGTNFFDRFSSGAAPGNTISPTDWEQYSIGAKQCRLSIDLSELADTTDPSSNAFRLTVAPTFGATAANPQGGNLMPLRCSRGAGWRRPGQPAISNAVGGWSTLPAGDLWPVQDNATSPQFAVPDGRRYLTLDLEVLPAFLAAIGADDVTVNNSIWIGPRYNGPNETLDLDTNPGRPVDNTNISPPNFPSTPQDFALIITGSNDLSAYTNGLTLITPWRVYFADDFNQVAPANSATNPGWFHKVSIYAPEKRFGTAPNSQNINVIGSLGYLPSNSGTAGNNTNINPLDLRDGGTDSLTPANIRATLSPVQQTQNLPPINAMSWLTVIEEL